MRYSVVLGLTGLGIVLLAGGAILVGVAFFDAPPLMGAAALVAVTAAGYWTQQMARGLSREARLRRATRRTSPESQELIRELLGEHNEYVIEAAQKLGAARDVSAVPTLICVLEACVDRQRPGWRDMAEALVEALAQIGDRRALPLLCRLENVRGIGFIPAVRRAIASIEPQTSLLRAGSVADLDTESLLRPVRHADANPATLLRPRSTRPENGNDTTDLVETLASPQPLP